jgi:hypothetical protein
MKKSILSITLVAMYFVSCKKAYKCECTTEDSYSKVVNTKDISKTSKKNAQAICGNSTSVYSDPYSSGSSTSPYTENTTCVLK